MLNSSRKNHILIVSERTAWSSKISQRLLASRAKLKPRHTTGREKSLQWRCICRLDSRYPVRSQPGNVFVNWTSAVIRVRAREMSSSDYNESNNNSCLSLNSVDIKRNPISNQLSCQDYLHFRGKFKKIIILRSTFTRSAQSKVFISFLLFDDPFQRPRAEESQEIQR